MYVLFLQQRKAPVEGRQEYCAIFRYCGPLKPIAALLPHPRIARMSDFAGSLGGRRLAPQRNGSHVRRRDAIAPAKVPIEV